MKKGNLYEKIPKKLYKELFNKIISEKGIKIERIVSRKHITPKGKWYNQNKNEFVLVLKGNAKLRFEKNKIINVKKGDYIIIPAHLKHRVEKTDKETIWLVVFY